MLATLVAVFVLFATATATAAPVDDANNATKPIDIGIDVGAYMYGWTPSPVLVYNASVDDAGAEFLSLRFTAFNIPSSDYVVLRAMNGSVAQVYSYSMVNGSIVPFFSVPIFSNRMRLEVYSTGESNTSTRWSIRVDAYRYSGTPDSPEGDCSPTSTASPPPCRNSPREPFFRGSQAVARLLINDATGVKWCTGWLVGCQNHVLTNYHCISSQAQATATTFDFRAYSHVCDKNACSTAGACPGTSIVYGGELVASSQSLDYALVQLNVSIAKGNYLRLQNFTGVGGAPIYIPQHPFGQGMLVGIKTPSTGNGQVLTSSYANCGMNNLLGYMIPTAPGSSGSPVIAYNNVVVGMHSCGGACSSSLNGGIPAHLIVADLVQQEKLPACALASTSPPANDPIPVSTLLGSLFYRALGVTMDVYALQIEASNQVLELRVTSYQQDLSPPYALRDVLGLCDASYFDAAVYLIAQDGGGDLSITAFNDNQYAATPNGFDMTSYDPYLNFAVSTGTYAVVVGTSSMTPLDALSAATAAFSSAASPPVYSGGTLLQCGAPHADVANYALHIAITGGNDSLSQVSGPNTSIGSSCSALAHPAPAPLTMCPYHNTPPLYINSAVYGTVATSDNGSIATTIHVPFELLHGTLLSIDVVSYVEWDNGSLHHDGQCDPAYLDSVLYVFQDTTDNNLQLLDKRFVILAVDDAPVTDRDAGLAISSRDPYVKAFLPAGKYVAVIGRYPLTVDDARFVTALSPRTNAHADALGPELGPWMAARPWPRATARIFFAVSMSDALVPPVSTTTPHDCFHHE